MSALSTPGGGGTTAQSKPTSGKQRFQKLNINSLYCANKNESSEPSSVKSQLSRKHGMQSLGKVPSARRPPANLPSLKTETGQDPNSNSISATASSTTPPVTCTAQTVTTTSSSGLVAATAPGGWVALPPPSSPHFRTEFPSLEAAAQPVHRSSEHATAQTQLRPQTEGSWTCGGTAGVRQETTSPAAAPAATPVTQQIPALRSILPSFLMKGSTGGGLGLGPPLGTLRDPRSGGNTNVSNAGAPRPVSRPPPATPRAIEVLTSKPILREEQISSLDDISREAGWAQQDDIDYDQKLDFSDGESSGPAHTNKSNTKNNNRTNYENDRMETKVQEPGDEEQLWAERRQKQSNEVAQAVARARQRKEEEQRRQLRDAAPPLQQAKDSRDRNEKSERDRNDNREREIEIREKDTRERERADNRERDRMDPRDKDWNDPRDRENREKDMRDRDRTDKDRFDNRDRERDVRDRERLDVRDRDRLDINRARNDNRDRQENEKGVDTRDRDRNDARDRERFDRERERSDRDRDRSERERAERDRDRDFRDRERDYGRDREQNNPAFSKVFQQNIPPRFLKQQQNRQQEEQHKGWAFTGKTAPLRRQEPPQYNAPRHAPHNGRRSYSRDYSDREDDFRRDKDGTPWRSEMQDYDRPSRELDRSNSKESYKDFSDYKDRRNESERKSVDSIGDHSSKTSAADKLTEVFERKSVGITEPLVASELVQSQISDTRSSPVSSLSKSESLDRDFSKASWADVAQEEQLKSSIEQITSPKDNQTIVKDSTLSDIDELKHAPQSIAQTVGSTTTTTTTNTTINLASQTQTQKHNTSTHSIQKITPTQQVSPIVSYASNQSHPISTFTQSQTSFSETQLVSRNSNQPSPKTINHIETITNQFLSSEQATQQPIKPIISIQKSEKDVSECESVTSKSSTDPSRTIITKNVETHSAESVQDNIDMEKRLNDDKKNERLSNEHLNKISVKEPIERKSSGSGSEKKGRGYGGGGYAVYIRGWGSRESRGRRPHRNSRSNNRASESEGSTDGTPNAERKERRRPHRSPRGPKKSDRCDDTNRPPPIEQTVHLTDGMENREPFAPRGQPSRRGRGGFQGTTRPPAPAKRVTGYGPPNTKSPFSQANRAVKGENEETGKDNSLTDDKVKLNSNKQRTGSSSGRGRDRRPKAASGHLSGEDENWETTSEHSEGGSAMGRRLGAGRQSGSSQKGSSGRNQNSNNRQNNGRNSQAGKKDITLDGKSGDISEALTDLKISGNKKDEEAVDDGFQEVRNKKNSKDTKGGGKEDNQNIQKQRSHSNQGSNGRNGSSSRNPNDKNNSRAPAPISSKVNSQYDRPRLANLAPRFVKQRQKQQMGLVSGFGGPDSGAVPPPPTVNAWDKPISQTLRGNVEEAVEVSENKSGHSSQRSTPAECPVETKSQPACVLVSETVGVLDGTTPPVETIIFENTNYKSTPPAEALKPKYQPSVSTAKPQGEPQDINSEIETRPINFNGDVRQPPRSIQELIVEPPRPVNDGEGLGSLQMSFETSQKAEDSSDMKLDFAFDSDLGQLTEDKSGKSLGLPRSTHMSTSNTISPLTADLNLKIASVKKVWEMPAVAEGSEDLQFAGFEEANAETAPPNVCKVKPTQQLQSPPPQHYNHVGYQGGYGGLSVPSPPAVLFNSSQQLLGSSQQLPQPGGLYGAFLDQSRGQFGGFPGTPYGAGSAAPYNYQPPPDMFQSLPNQYRMAATGGGGAAFGQSGQLGNNPSTVLISSTSNSLMSATVKPSSQQIGAIGSKGGVGVGGVGGVGGVSSYQQQYLGYSAPVGEAPYSLPGLLPARPPASSYYSPYQPTAAPANYPLQFTQPAQSGAFGSQFLSTQLQAAAAAVQQMQQQYRGPMQQQFAPPAPRPPPQQPLKSPLHEHSNGFAPLCDSASPTPKGVKPQKPPHSPPQHKYHAPPPPHAHPTHPPPALTPHQQHQQHQHMSHAQHQHQSHQQHQQQHQQHQQMVGGGNNGRCGSNPGPMGRGGMPAPRYPSPIQRPHAPAMPMYRAPPAPAPRPLHTQRPNLYYHHHQRNGAGSVERVTEGEVPPATDEQNDPPSAPEPVPPAEVKAE